MFCIHCGKQLPDDARFCSACGRSTAQKAAPASARPTASTNPRPAAQTQSRPAPAAKPAGSAAPKPTQNTNQQDEKKGSNVFVMIVVFILIYVVAYNVTRKNNTPDTTSSIFSTTAPTTASASFNAPSGQSFDQILPKRYLADKSKFQTSGYDAYVKENTDGMIYLHEYGYEGDLVKELSITTIMPTPGWSTSDIGSLLIETDELLEELMAEHSFITGNSQIVGDYEYVAVVVHMKDLDKEENTRAAEEEQLILLENSAKLISMSQTENSLRIAGYAKK